MLSRGKVYLETTVISYLVARPSRDLRVAAHQQATSEWWVQKREGFELFVSQLVIEEASAGDEAAAARRLKYLEGIRLLDLTEPTVVLAESLLASAAVGGGRRCAAHRTRCRARYGLPLDLELQAHCERDHAQSHRSRLL